MGRKKKQTIDDASGYPIPKQATAEKWLERIEKTVCEFRDHENGIKRWRNAYKLYKGDHWSSVKSKKEQLDPDSARARELITVNVIKSNINLLLSYVLNKDPYFYTEPKPGHEELDLTLSENMEGTVNYFWKEKEMQEQVKKAALDAYIIGHGIIRTGYDLQEDYVQNEAEDGTITYEQFITKDTPYARAVFPEAFIWDLESSQHDLKTARWCAETFAKHKEDIIANEGYDKKVRAKIESGEYTPGRLSQEDGYESRTDLPYEDERCLLYEIWDKKYKLRYVFAKDVPEPLLVKPWPYSDANGQVYLDGFPYIMLEYDPTPWEPFAQGLVYNAIDQQLELNRIRTYMFQHIRRFNRKYQLIIGNLVKDSKTAKKDLESGADGTIIECKNGPAVIPIEDGPIPADKFNVEAVIKKDLDDLMGVSDSLKGATVAPRTPATGINMQAAAINTKMDVYVSNMNNFVVAIGTQILQHCQQFMVTSQAIKILGSQGETWRNLTRDEIQGEFAFNLESTSKPKTNPEVRTQQMMLFLEKFIMPLTEAGVIMPDWMAILRDFGKVLQIPQLTRWIPQLATQGAVATGGSTAEPGETTASQPAGVPMNQQILQAGAVNPASAAMGGAMGGSTNGGGSY